MTCHDTNDVDAEGRPREKTGRVILAGGEILLDPARERVLYPAIDLDLQRKKYAARGGVHLIMQTTGDVVTESIVDELLDHGVWMISVSGIDAFHEGLETEDSRSRLPAKLTRLFENHGVRYFEPVADGVAQAPGEGPLYHFFGTTPESWIGALWLRARAFDNGLSTAGFRDNFCNNWSGGLNFLQHRHSGAEVSIEPGGNGYLCCVKTKAPIGIWSRNNRKES